MEITTEEASEASASYPENTDIVLRDGFLSWTDGTTREPHSAPTDQLIAILPQSSSLHPTGTDDTAPALTALYLEREQAEDGSGKGEHEHGVRLKTLAIPEDLFYAGGLKKYILPQVPAHLQHSTSNTRDEEEEEGEDRSESRRDIHVIISTLSGTQGALPFFENALQPLLDIVSAKYKVHRTESARTIIELCSRVFLPRARAGVQQTVILLSGDGGVVDVIRMFSESKDQQHDTSSTSTSSASTSTSTSLAAARFVPPTLCLIPMGTGNATANSAGLASDATLGLSALLRGTPSDLPTFRVRLPRDAVYVTDEGRKREPVAGSQHAAGTGSGSATIYGAVVLSWGMHASLVADSDTAEYRKFGAERFKMAATELLWPADGRQTHRYKGKVRVTPTCTTKDDKNQAAKVEDEVEVDRTEHMYVLATLVSQLEKGFTISPSSTPLDGQLRLVHFGPLSAERAMEIMARAYQGGKHVAEPEVAYEDVEKVRIEFQEEGEEEEEEERWRRICLDGTIVAVSRGGFVEVERERRRLVKLVAP